MEPASLNLAPKPKDNPQTTEHIIPIKLTCMNPNPSQHKTNETLNPKTLYILGPTGYVTNDPSNPKARHPKPYQPCKQEQPQNPHAKPYKLCRQHKKNPTTVHPKPYKRFKQNNWS